MPKITREQVEKINAKMGNGWKLDLYYFLMRGEKTAVLEIPQPDGGYIQGKLYINNVFDWRKDAYNGIQIKLNVSRWHKGNADGVYTSNGLGYWIEINRPDLKKAMFSEVQKITHTLRAADILDIYSEHAPQIASARVM